MYYILNCKYITIRDTVVFTNARAKNNNECSHSSDSKGMLYESEFRGRINSGLRFIFRLPFSPSVRSRTRPSSTLLITATGAL